VSVTTTTGVSSPVAWSTTSWNSGWLSSVSAWSIAASMAATTSRVPWVVVTGQARRVLAQSSTTPLMRQMPPARLSSSQQVGLPHAVASGRRVGEHRPACLGELAALGLVADRLQQSAAAKARRTEDGLAATPSAASSPQILRWPQAAHCSACLAARGSMRSTTGAGSDHLEVLEAG
jgi:hypothetical protein